MKKQEKSQVVLTAGAVTERYVLDLLAPVPPNKSLRLIVGGDAGSGHPAVHSEALIDGRLYGPIALDDDLLRAIRLPEKSITCSSTRKLFERVKREISSRVALLDPDPAVSLTTCFVFSTWVADRLQFLPPLVISGPRDEAHKLLRILGWMCRRPIPLGMLGSGLPRVVSRLNPTLLIFEPELSRGAQQFLRGSSVPGTTLVANGGLNSGFCAKAIHTGDSCAPEIFGRAIHIVVDRPAVAKPWPTPSEEEVLAAELQARLLGYRLKSCRQIAVRHIDGTGLTPEVRRVAEVLAAVVDEPDLVAALPEWLVDDEGWSQAEALVDIKKVVIEATLALVHRGGSEFKVGEACKGAAAILCNRGESRLKYSPREVGGVLRSLGLKGKRQAAGVEIKLSDAITKRVHALARLHRIPPCDMPGACGFCGGG